jgi:hypothetical protein
LYVEPEGEPKGDADSKKKDPAEHKERVTKYPGQDFAHGAKRLGRLFNFTVKLSIRNEALGTSHG